MWNRVIELTEKGERLRKWLIGMCIIYSIILIIRILFVNSGFSITTMIIEIVFVLSIIMCHYALLSFLVIMLLYNFINSFIALGTLMQRYWFDKISNEGMPFYYVMIIEIVYLIVIGLTIHWVFRAYKEFKYILLSNHHYQLNQDDIELKQKGPINNNTSKRGFKAFSGKGTLLG